MVVCRPWRPYHPSMCTHVEVVVGWVTNAFINNGSWGNIIRRSCSEKLRVVSFLCNDHGELRKPTCVKVLACLNDLFQLNVENLIKLWLTDSIPCLQKKTQQNLAMPKKSSQNIRQDATLKDESNIFEWAHNQVIRFVQIETGRYKQLQIRTSSKVLMKEGCFQFQLLVNCDQQKLHIKKCYAGIPI